MSPFPFRRKRHVHDKDPRVIRQLDLGGFTVIQECSCGMRRTQRIGFGSESGVYHSRWYDSQEIDKLKMLFPGYFKATLTQCDAKAKEIDAHE